jgi:hypothetical protein
MGYALLVPLTARIKLTKKPIVSGQNTTYLTISYPDALKKLKSHNRIRNSTWVIVQMFIRISASAVSGLVNEMPVTLLIRLYRLFVAPWVIYVLLALWNARYSTTRQTIPAIT